MPDLGIKRLKSLITQTEQLDAGEAFESAADTAVATLREPVRGAVG